jgi:hypothetical protein
MSRSTVGANASAVGSCRTQEDCSLGGECVASKCICDPMWTGPTCVALNLGPAPTTPLVNNSGDQSWGGNTVYDHSDGLWHLFFAEFLNDCPLGTWGTNYVVSHAVSTNPQGPYGRRGVVKPAFHHNPSRGLR